MLSAGENNGAVKTLGGNCCWCNNMAFTTLWNIYGFEKKQTDSEIVGDETLIDSQSTNVFFPH